MKKKRFWLVSFLVLICGYVFFFQIPRSCPVSQETHEITAPLTADGQCDYFAELENSEAKFFQDPDQNGFRDVLQALGPVALGYLHLHEKCTWEELPTSEASAVFWNDVWLPICKKLSINPLDKPRFADYVSFVDYIETHRPAGPSDEEFDPKEYFEKLETEIWSSEKHPWAAAWLKQADPVLNVVVEAARKPIYRAPTFTPDWDGKEYPLYFCAHYERESALFFGHGLRLRIHHMLGTGHAEDAVLEDILTLFRLGRHLMQSDFWELRSSGATIEKMGQEEVRILLESGLASDTQRKTLAESLARLMPIPPVDAAWRNNRILFWDLTQRFFNGRRNIPYFDNYDDHKLPMLLKMPLNEKILRQHLRENLAVLERGGEPLKERITYISAVEFCPVRWWRVLLSIRYRSVLAADLIFVLNFTDVYHWSQNVSECEAATAVVCGKLVE